MFCLLGLSMPQSLPLYNKMHNPDIYFLIKKNKNLRIVESIRQISAFLRQITDTNHHFTGSDHFFSCCFIIFFPSIC